MILDPAGPGPMRAASPGGFATGATQWPPPYEGMVAAPAGEPASPGWQLPTFGQLSYAHMTAQLVFMALAFVGLLVLLRERGPRATVRELGKRPKL